MMVQNTRLMEIAFAQHIPEVQLLAQWRQHTWGHLVLFSLYVVTS